MLKLWLSLAVALGLCVNVTSADGPDKADAKRAEQDNKIAELATRAAEAKRAAAIAQQAAEAQRKVTEVAVNQLVEAKKAIEAARRSDQAGSDAPRSEQVRQQIDMLARKATELAAQGRGDEATNVFAYIQQILSHVAESRQAERAGADAPQVEQVRQQITMMLRKATEVAEKGRGEEAAKIREQAQQILSHVAESRRAERAGSDVAGQSSDRIRHIREAAEHLRAAGLKDLADELLKKTELIKP